MEVEALRKCINSPKIVYFTLIYFMTLVSEFAGYIIIWGINKVYAGLTMITYIICMFNMGRKEQNWVSGMTKKNKTKTLPWCSAMASVHGQGPGNGGSNRVTMTNAYG